MNGHSAEHFLKASAACQDPADGLAEIRRQALELLAADGLPNRRQEAWRYTDVSAICNQEWDTEVAETPALRAQQFAPWCFPDLDCHRCVFVNGHYLPELSTPAPDTPGLVLSDLGTARAAHAELLQRQVGHYADPEYRFAALNAAFMRQGAVIMVPDRLCLSRPIQLCFITTGTARGSPFASHPHILLVLGRDSEATVIENYIGLGDGQCYFNNSVCEARLQSGARLQHYRIQQETDSAQHIGHLFVDQGRDAKLYSCSIALGAALARVNIHSRLCDPGAEAALHGLYVADGTRHLDHHIRIDHLAGHTSSQEHFRGILDDRGHGVFSGKIIVHPDAQHIQAEQSNPNLILSDRATADVRPELEIHADDVQCRHGATIGSMDDAMLFYLRSRGIEESTARGLLSFAFAAGVLDALRLEPIRRYLEAQVIGRLQDAEQLRHFVSEA